MKTYYHKFVILLLFLSSLPVSQCGIIFGPESPRFVVHPPEGRINFSIFEDYETYDSISEPFLKLSMITEKLYGSGCYSIMANINIVEDNVIVRIFGIKEQLGICAAVEIHASFTDKLILENGEYDLLFFYKETIDSYYLTVTDSGIRIEQDRAEIMFAEQETYWRYPENSFAYFLGIYDDSIWLYEEFFDTLTTSLSITEFQFPDYGNNPYQLSYMGHSNIEFPARFFKYENEEDFEKAGDILKLYTENVIKNNFSVSLTLINWKNRRFSAWQFMDK